MHPVSGMPLKLHTLQTFRSGLWTSALVCVHSKKRQNMEEPLFLSACLVQNQWIFWLIFDGNQDLWRRQPETHWRLTFNLLWWCLTSFYQTYFCSLGSSWSQCQQKIIVRNTFKTPRPKCKNWNSFWTSHHVVQLLSPRETAGWYFQYVKTSFWPFWDDPPISLRLRVRPDLGPDRVCSGKSKLPLGHWILVSEPTSQPVCPPPSVFCCFISTQSFSLSVCVINSWLYWTQMLQIPPFLANENRSCSRSSEEDKHSAVLHFNCFIRNVSVYWTYNIVFSQQSVQ